MVNFYEFISENLQKLLLVMFSENLVKTHFRMSSEISFWIRNDF